MLTINGIKDGIMYGTVVTAQDIKSLVAEAKAKNCIGFQAKTEDGRYFDDKGKRTEGIVLFAPVESLKTEQTEEAVVVTPAVVEEQPVVLIEEKPLSKLEKFKNKLENAKVEKAALEEKVANLTKSNKEFDEKFSAQLLVIEGYKAEISKLEEKVSKLEVENLNLVNKVEELERVNKEFDELVDDYVL